jgi:hypothetical protein
VGFEGRPVRGVCRDRTIKFGATLFDVRSANPPQGAWMASPCRAARRCGRLPATSARRSGRDHRRGTRNAAATIAGSTLPDIPIRPPRQPDLDHAGGLYSSQLRARVTGLNTVAAGAISTTMKASSPCRSPSCSRWGLERHHTDGRERGLDGRREMIPRGRHRRRLGSDHSRMPSHSRTC